MEIEIENNEQLRNSFSSRTSVLFRVLRRRVNPTEENNVINIFTSNSTNSSRRNPSSEEGYNVVLNQENRITTTLIGLRSLFERIFQGLINFNRVINNENLIVTNSSMSFGGGELRITTDSSNSNSNGNVTSETENEENKETMNNLMKVLTSCDSEYIDFRTYPLKMDWKEIEKGKSFAYEAMTYFGYLGASIYTNLNRLNSFGISYKKMPKEILLIYIELIKELKESYSYEKQKKIQSFISELPNTIELETILLNSYTCFKEYLLICVLLHLLFHYYSFIEIDFIQKKFILELIEYFIIHYLSELDFLSILRSIVTQMSYKKLYSELKLDSNYLFNLEKIKSDIAQKNVLIMGTETHKKKGNEDSLRESFII